MAQHEVCNPITLCHQAVTDPPENSSCKDCDYPRWPRFIYRNFYRPRRLPHQLLIILPLFIQRSVRRGQEQHYDLARSDSLRFRTIPRLGIPAPANSSQHLYQPDRLRRSLALSRQAQHPWTPSFSYRGDRAPRYERASPGVGFREDLGPNYGWISVERNSVGEYCTSYAGTATN